MARFDRWALALAVAAVFSVFAGASASGPSSPTCVLIAHTSNDLQNFLDSDIVPDCDTLQLQEQEYTLLPFNLTGTSRTIIGSSSAATVIRYSASATLSHLSEDTHLQIYRTSIVSDGLFGGFLSLFGSFNHEAKLDLEDVEFKGFNLSKTAIIEGESYTKIALRRTKFADTTCTVLPNVPRACERGVLYVGRLEATTNWLSLFDVTFQGFRASRQGSKKTIYAGLYIETNGLVYVKTTNVLFENNAGASLQSLAWAEPFHGRIYIRAIEDSTWTFKDNTDAPACASLFGTESTISWSFVNNTIDLNALSIQSSVVHATSIFMSGNLCARQNTIFSDGVSSLLSADLSAVISDSITIQGAENVEQAMRIFSGVRSKASTFASRVVHASGLYAGIHVFPTKGSSLFNVSQEMVLEKNFGGIFMELLEDDPSPVLMNVTKLTISKNGLMKRFRTSAIGGIYIKNSIRRTNELSNLLDITSDEILLRDNVASKGAAISFTTPFALRSPSIQFISNRATASGGVYYSANPDLKDFLPGELFQSTTTYSLNSAPQGCIISFNQDGECAAYQPFQATFDSNLNETLFTSATSCLVSDQYCISPEARCGNKPSFGTRSLWRYDSLCGLSYAGDLEIPAGTDITKTFDVVGKLTFEDPLPDDPRKSGYSLKFQPGIYIATGNTGLPLALPKLPISYSFRDADVEYDTVPIIMTYGTSIISTSLPRVDFFVIGSPKGVKAVCDNPIPPSRILQVLENFGFEKCHLIYPAGIKLSKKIIVVIAVGSALFVALLAAIVTGIVCYVCVKKKVPTLESQSLLSETEY